MNSIFSNSAMNPYASPYGAQHVAKFDVSAIRPVSQNNGRSAFNITSGQGDAIGQGDAFGQEMSEAARRKEQDIFEQKSRATSSTFMARTGVASNKSEESGQSGKFAGALNFEEVDGFVVITEEQSAASKPEASKSSARLNANKIYMDETLAALEDGASLVDAMMEAKGKVFNLLFEEQMAENGGNVEDALNGARARMPMDISDEELFGIVEDMAKEYEGVDVKITDDLNAYLTKLQEKMDLEEIQKKLSAEKMDRTDNPITDSTTSKTNNRATDSVGNSSALQAQNLNSKIKSTGPQVGTQTTDLFHSKYLENQRNSRGTRDVARQSAPLDIFA